MKILKKKKLGSRFEKWIDGTLEKKPSFSIKEKTHSLTSKMSAKVTDFKYSAGEKVKGSSVFSKFIPKREKVVEEYEDEYDDDYEEEYEDEYDVEYIEDNVRKSRRTEKTGEQLPGFGFADLVTKSPWVTILIMAAITLAFATQIPKLDIHGEMEVYLPKGEETSDIVEDVREYWSTDVIMIYTEIEDPYNDTKNVSNVEILKEMSYIEEEIDPLKDDRGEEDNIIWALSISTIIKEVNETPPRLRDASLKNLEALLKSYNVPIIPIVKEAIYEAVDIPISMGEYSIPDQQDRIDSTLNNLPENLRKMLVIDINHDDIWDSCVIIFGITEDIKPKEIIDRLNKVIDSRESNFTKMTQTGTVPLTQFATDKAFYYYYWCFMLASGLVVAAIFIFHRSMKAVLISGSPTVCSIAWIYGFLGITQIAVTPTIIVLGPIILALGVSYGIHMANRIAEEPDEDPRVRAKKAIKTTGIAVFLSAVTTMIGFSSLMFTNLMPVRTVGFSLTLGIFFCFILTMIMSPALAVITNYRKRGTISSWNKVAKIPIKNSKLIIIFVIITLIISVAICLPLIERDTDLLAYAPNKDTDVFGRKIEDFEMVEAGLKYTKNFDGGALGMVLVEGLLRSDKYRDSGEDPVDNLDEIEKIEDDINEITKRNKKLKVKAISIVTILKAVGGEGNISLDRLFIGEIGNIISPFIPEELLIGITLEGSFWDVLHDPAIDNEQNKPLQKFLLNVFYDSLSDESRGMLINEYRTNETTDEPYDEYYKKTLIYVDMPIMSDKLAHKVVAEVNKICDEPHYPLQVTRLTGVAAVAVTVNDMMYKSQIISLVLAIVFVFITLLIIFRYTKPYKNALKLSILATLTICIIVGLEPLVMKIFNTELNLATIMIGSSIIGAGVDFSIHITQRVRESGESLKSVKRAIETSGMGLFEATMITVAGLCSAFIVPAPAIFKFIFVVMIMLVLSAVAAMFILPAIYTELIKGKERKRYRRKVIGDYENEDYYEEE